MNPLTLNAQLRLKELFDRCPETIPVFISHRMSCVGCDMAAFDTLEEAAANYHLPWAPFLAELQAAILPLRSTAG